jgi:hypothetical protein
MIKRVLALLFVLGLFLPAPARAQLGTVPHSFTTGINDIDDLNENFSTAYANALNRTGGTMTGQLTAQAIVPASTATYDIGSSLTKFRDLFLSRNLDVSGDFTLAGSLSDSNSAVTIADQLITTTTTLPQLQLRYDGSNYLGVSISSAGAVTFDATGASAGVTFADAVTVSGTLNAATLGASTTAAGAWSFTSSGNAITIESVNPIMRWSETGVTANNGLWRMYTDVEDFYFQTLNDSGAGEINIFKVSRTGTAVDSFTISAPLITTGVITPPTGSASAPTYAFTGDTNTGMYSQSANEISFSTDGTRRFNIDSTTTSVDGNLSVAGSASVGTRVAITTTFFANLSGVESNGGIRYCSDCTIANPCAGGGTGAFAKRLNNVWVCN